MKAFASGWLMCLAHKSVYCLPSWVRFYIWEILHSTIRKMNKHVLMIQKDLEDAKARLAKQRRRVGNMGGGGGGHGAGMKRCLASKMLLGSKGSNSHSFPSKNARPALLDQSNSPSAQ